MMSMGDIRNGPIIEEIIDSPRRNQPILRDANQRGGGTVDEAIAELMRNPQTKGDPTLLKRVIYLLGRKVEELENDQVYEGYDEEREEEIEKIRDRKKKYEGAMEAAEKRFWERRDREAIEETRRARTVNSNYELSNRENSTRLHESSSYGRRKEQSTRNYQSDDDERDTMTYSRARSPINRTTSRDHQSSSQNSTQYYQNSRAHSRHHTINESPMPNRRRSPPPSRSHQQSSRPAPRSPRASTSAGPPPVRMHRGKSTLTKTTFKRYRPGAKALQEIRKYQKSTDMLIAKAPFRRLVHEVMQEMSFGVKYRIQSEALGALQEAAEAFIVEMFESATFLTHHAKRVTLLPADIQLYRRLCLRF